MADYTAAAKAAIKTAKARKQGAPRPGNTAGRQLTSPPPRAPATPRAATPAPAPAPAPPRSAPPRADRSGPAARASAPSRNTGPYAAGLDALDTEGRQVSDVERRRLNDNQRYQEWLNAGNAKSAAAMRQSGMDQQARSSRIQAQTSAAQQQIQNTLDAQRAARPGTVTEGPGNSRARLAGDDALTQSLLASEQQRASITSESAQQKQGFLNAATAATGAADAARIRGDAGTQLQDIGRRRGDLLVHAEDTLSAERAARAQAAADALKAQLDDARANREIDARVAIAQAQIDQRSSDSAADRDAADRRDRRRDARAERDDRKVSPAERRQRADDARQLDNEIARATAAATALSRGGKTKDGTKIPGTTDPDTLRAGILALYPNISADALDAAVASVSGAGGVLGSVNRSRSRSRTAKARRRRLQGRG